MPRPMMTLCAALTLALAICSLVGQGARAETKVDPKTTPIAPRMETLETTIGMEGEYFLRRSGPLLEAKPYQEDAPVVVRIVSVTETSTKIPSNLYHIRYVGNRAGEYDLQDFLTTVDGRSANATLPIVIKVREQLPADHAGGLEELATAPMKKSWSYRRLVEIACGVWLLPVVGFIVVRWWRRKKTPPPVVSRTLTTEEELRALIDVVLAGGLDTARQARLEELLIRYWRESLDVGKLPTMELISRLKQEPRTAPLIAQLETWLYRRPETAKVDVEKLLAQFRQTPLRESRSPAAGGRSGQ